VAVATKAGPTRHLAHHRPARSANPFAAALFLVLTGMLGPRSQPVRRREAETGGPTPDG